ncbi:MAG: histidinol-phosphatase [Cyclobacteriaceae bacterium]|nr:histidinol-phosphatase [Cyclobacteriaceae bacterium]
MWTNYHTHSNYCDGKESPAIYLNDPAICSLGFSSHAPLPFDCKWCMPSKKLEAYFTEIAALKQSSPIEIYCGLEVDFIPGLISPKDFTQADYTIGSIHFVEQFENTPWEIDGLHTTFTEGLDKIFKNYYRAAWCRYFELTRQMLIESQPDVLGHLDKMKIQNLGNKYFHENESWYQQEIRSLLKVASQTNTIIEINTRGIYQQKSETTYPSPWILELMKTLNIRVTISSDAHHPKDLCNQFELAASLLLKAGYKKITILKDGVWKEVNFNENGIGSS